MNAQHSSERPNLGTPDHIVAIARYAMGGISLDPFSSAKHNERVKADDFYAGPGRSVMTGRGDGTDPKLYWHGKVFVNPPGGLVDEAWKRVWIAIARHEVTSIFWVGFSLEQLAYLEPHPFAPVNGSVCCLLRRRLAFLDEMTGEPLKTLDKKTGKMKRSSPTHSNYLWCYGYENTRARFMTAIEEAGLGAGPFLGDGDRDDPGERAMNDYD